MFFFFELWRCMNSWYKLFLSSEIIWHKYSLFWWSRSVSMTCFSLHYQDPMISLSLSLSPLQLGTKNTTKIFFYTKIKLNNFEGPKLYNLRDCLGWRTKIHLFQNSWYVVHVCCILHFDPSFSNPTIS